MIKTENAWLMFGDCLERMKEIPSGSVDMVLTDPPYGTTACKWDSIIPLEPMWEQLKRIIKPNGAIVMTASQPFTTTLISSNMGMFKYCWVWEKQQPTGFLNARRFPLRAHEDIVVFCNGTHTYNPQGLKSVTVKNSRKNKSGNGCYGSVDAKDYTQKEGNFPRSVIKVSRVTHKQVHPTQKPVALMEYLIKTYTNEGETVLDFTMGSGSTGVACVNTGRKFIGIELDPTYYGIACERVLTEPPALRYADDDDNLTEDEPE